MSSSQFVSAWSDEHFTAEQQEWLRNETAALGTLLNQQQTPTMLCDIGCGVPRRIIPLVEDHANIAYFGIDSDQETIAAARQEYGNDEHLEFFAEDYANALVRLTKAKMADRLVICLGNTLGTIRGFNGEHRAHIRHMAEHADLLVISVVESKPEVTYKRLEYYMKNRINCSTNWETGVITSEKWGNSLAFRRRDLLSADLAENFDIDFKEIPPLGLMMIAKRTTW